MSGHVIRVMSHRTRVRTYVSRARNIDTYMMADQKKAPQLFHSDLFSSPGNIGSSGLSLGFDEPFSSPFSLAPASKQDGKCGNEM